MKCKAKVPVRPHYIRSYRCSREAVKGSSYCAQHKKKFEKRSD